MNLKDLIALAKQGYTPADIRDLIALSDKADDPAQSQVEEAEQKTTPEEAPKEEAEPVNDADAIDYKKLYEEEKTKNDQLSANLQKAQSNNVSMDMSHKTDSKTDEDILNDFVKSFM